MTALSDVFIAVLFAAIIFVPPFAKKPPMIGAAPDAH